MSFSFSLPPFVPDTRGSKLSGHKIVPGKHGGREEVLLMCCSREVAEQFALLADKECTPATLTQKGAEKWTHAFRFASGVPRWALDLLDLLSQSVTLAGRRWIDLGMSVDWYKQANEKGELVNTAMGTCINRTKYAPYPNGSGSVAARKELLRAMTDFINRHPVYANTSLVTAPPGHKADGNSLAERLARAVAKSTGKSYIEMTAAGERAEQKEAEARDLTEEFTLSQVVHEGIVIIDDVFHTGATLDAAAIAARRAGATSVFTLTAARTLRK